MNNAVWISSPENRKRRAAGRAALLVAALLVPALIGRPVHASDQAEAKAPAKPDKPWSITLEAGMQNDDSVSIDAVDNRSGRADQARVVNLGGAYTLFQTSALPLKVSYGFADTSHEDLKAFDLQSHTAFLSTGRKLSVFDAGLLYGFSHTDLDGKPFLNFHTLSPTLGYGLTTNWYALAGYNYQNKTFHTAKTRNAQLNGLSLDNFVFFNETRSYLKFGYLIEYEDAASNEFDYIGHHVNIGLKSTLSESPGAATVRFTYQYSLKNYTKLTSSIGAEREDQRHTAKAEIALPVHENAQFKFAYKYIKAHSNVSSSDFDENVVNVSLALGF